MHNITLESTFINKYSVLQFFSFFFIDFSRYPSLVGIKSELAKKRYYFLWNFKV